TDASIVALPSLSCAPGAGQQNCAPCGSPGTTPKRMPTRRRIYWPGLRRCCIAAECRARNLLKGQWQSPSTGDRVLAKTKTEEYAPMKPDGTAERHRRFGDLADDIAARMPDREGLVFGSARYTFREIASRIDDAARRLIAAGVGHGDHVALWLN